ncbi:ribonuclease Y, partial [Patescibacteria group bacterium]|nr:ribonuclease Y [Patescibacteria group bacterium]
MDLITSLIIIFIALGLGSVMGYYARQSIVKKRAGTIEARLHKRMEQVKAESSAILKQAQEKAAKVISKTEEEVDQRRREFLRTQQVLLDREKLLDKKISLSELKEEEFRQKVEKLKELKEELDKLRSEAEEKLEKVAKISREEAKKELLSLVEIEYQKEILEKLRKLEERGVEKIEKRAKEILALAMQKCAVPQVQELTTSTIVLQNEDIKGRIIGKEGRNIRAFEKLTGVEVIVDETPESVVISSFNPIRRQIAKLALEKLIQDGRIQPAKIEEKVEEAKTEIAKKVRESGEKAVYETGVVGVDDKLMQLLGRLYYRTSYGQNVLLHSMEVAFLAEAIADEIGANSQVAKRAGLLHDIGKAVDHQVQGSHVDIGIKILQKFGESDEIIKAMQAHHEEHPVESIEAIIVKVADAISGARPGARKDSLENYLQRLKELEDIAMKFSGVERAYAIQAGREIRIFVKSDKIDDLGLQKLAKEIANKIEEELKYPGEIKVVAVRENRVV